MKKMKFIGVLILLFSCTHVDAAKSNAKEVEPDYTKGENPEGENKTPWALGSTGAYGISPNESIINQSYI